MRSVQYLLALGVALIVLSLSPEAVSAEEAAAPLGGEAKQAAATGTVTALFGTASVDDATLDGQRGGADTQLSKILANGKVSEVSASDLVTGNNIVTNGALSGASGLPLLIQNSGNGVLIQNAVIVNVEVN